MPPIYAAAQVNNLLLTQCFEVHGILALTQFTLCFALTSCARLLEWRRVRTRRQAGATWTGMANI